MKLAEIFTDNMVLQREKPIRIFGTGSADVNVRIGDISVKSDIASENEWMAVLPPMQAGGPYTIEVSDAQTQIELKNILIGDVWIISGQSNAEMPLLCDLRGIYEAEQCRNDSIRLYNCNTTTLPYDIPHYYENFSRWLPNEFGQWGICDTESALNVSAIGYYVAKFINKETNVPIGIINASKGGTKIESWLPREVFENPLLSQYMIDFNEHKMADDEAYEYIKAYADRSVAYKARLDSIGYSYEEITRDMGADAALRKVQSIVKAEELPLSIYHRDTPSIFYDRIIKGQVAPMSVKGIVWYQGESNQDNICGYKEKFELLADSWRKLFGDDLPFYTVEIAPYNFLSENDISALRHEQRCAAKDVSNCHIVTTQNLGDANNIHPLQKCEVARRISRQILNYEYSLTRPCESPSYNYCETHGNELWIHLNNSDGLYGYDNENMQIAGKDGVYKKASCEIRDNILVAKCNELEEPINAKYCYQNFYKNAHIYNASGMPLFPFSTEVYEEGELK